MAGGGKSLEVVKVPGPAQSGTAAPRGVGDRVAARRRERAGSATPARLERDGQATPTRHPRALLATGRRHWRVTGAAPTRRGGVGRGS
jgi:hypothetical protein